MGPTAESVQLVRHDLEYRVVSVRRTERISARMVRITFGGDELASFHAPGPADHVKVVFPLPGETTPIRPKDPSQGVRFADEPVRPSYRDYTPRRYDADNGELDIDFVLHGHGVASTWAADAKPGDQVAIAGPRGSVLVRPEFDWYLLIGDETAIPALARHLEMVPAGVPAYVFVEVVDAGDEVKFETAADADVRWFHRGEALPGETGELELALRELSFPAGDFYAFAGAEAVFLKPIRRFLVDERGARKEWTDISGYWKRDTVNHDHHADV